MFANLEMFLQEKDVYKQKVEEIRSSTQSDEELKKKLEEAEEVYRGQVRKYLSSAINVINKAFQCQYSIYKVGKDFNANFQVVETNIRKTRSEVIAEMETFKNQAANMTLTNEQITEINIAMEVLLTYSEDASDTVDENKEDFLKEAKVTTSSIITTPTRENNAFTPAPTVEPSFNPYANQPIEVDSGFKNPVYENKTLVDPFANIYGDKKNVSLNDIPEASMDFGAPTPPQPMPTFDAPQNPTVDAMSIFGVGITSASIDNNVPSSNNAQIPSHQPANNMQMMSNVMQPAPMPTNSMNSYNPQQSGMVPTVGNTNPYSYSSSIQNGNMASTVGNVNPYSVNPENGNMGVEKAIEQTSNKVITVDDKKKPEECAFIVSKIMKGILRLPITNLLFLGIIVLIFWGLEKANLLGDITNLLGDYMKYAEFALVLFIMLVGSSSVLDAMSTKTKYINKHAMTSLTLFAGVIYGLKLLFPIVMEKFLADQFSFEVNFQIVLYWEYYLVLAFFLATFTWLFAFLRTDKSVLKKKHLNIVEMVGALWTVYTFVIPAVMIGCGWCGISVVAEKANVIYDYAHCDLIIVIASFSLSLMMLVVSKLEEKKL